MTQNAIFANVNLAVQSFNLSHDYLLTQLWRHDAHQCYWHLCAVIGQLLVTWLNTHLWLVDAGLSSWVTQSRDKFGPQVLVSSSSWSEWKESLRLHNSKMFSIHKSSEEKYVFCWLRIPHFIIRLILSYLGSLLLGSRNGIFIELSNLTSTRNIWGNILYKLHISILQHQCCSISKYENIFYILIAAIDHI